MDILKPSHRHRFLKVWLIAIACQTGQLLSDIEIPYYQPYQTTADENDWHSFPSISDERRMHGSYPEGISHDQIQTLIYPDHNSRYSSPEPLYYTPYDQQSGQQPQNGQWPAFSNNEWEHLDTSSIQSYDNTVWHAFYNESPPIEQEHQDLFNASSPFQETDTAHFSPFPRPTQPGSDQQNFTTFNDPNLEKKEEKLEESTPLNVSEGKVKIVKKRADAISASRRLEEVLYQPEEVIGKAIANDSILGMVDEIESLQHLDDQQASLPLKEKGSPYPEKQVPLSTPSTFEEEESDQEENPPSEEHSIREDFLSTRENEHLNNEEIAQNPQAPVLPNVDIPLSIQPERTHPPITRPPTIITPTTPSAEPTPINQPAATKPLKEISINFNNVSMVEYIRFISRISNKNFIFDDEDLQFNVTIVSEEPTTVSNLMAALLQELRIRDLSLIEQGNNIIIHRNPRVRSPARIVTDDNKIITSHESELITRVFRLNTLDPVKASEIIRPLLSEEALIEVLRDTNNLIITDLVSNVNKIAQLIATLDAPNSGVTIGQYVVRNAFVDSLVDLANKILQPIAQGNPFVLVPHPVSNSIFIVSNSFIVEKALAILQNLDLNEGRTKILSLENLQPAYEALQPSYPPGTAPGAQGTIPGRGGLTPGYSGGIPGVGQGIGPSATPSTGGGGIGAAGMQGRFGPGGSAGEFGPDGLPNQFGPGGVGQGGYGPNGEFNNPEAVPSSFPFGELSVEGRITPPVIPTPASIFHPGGIGTEGKPSAIFDESRSFLPGGIGSSSRWSRELPVGHIERTLFFIYKLRYRKGDNIEIALRKIGNSLQMTGTANADLISAINSSQWIESSNALIFTGTAVALEKVRELILEVDIPLKQVFIEMLILDTTIQDSLSYSVDWINRFGGGTTTGEQGFLEAAPGNIASTNQFLTASETIFNTGSTIADTIASPLPVATGFLNSGGFAAGVIGTHLTHNGTRFSSIGALVRAIHSDTKADIVLNPKIITEDNNPAEIFVGGTDRYKTQSITNDLGSLVTNNFQFIDVGTTLRVTPLIGNNGIITLEIVQETTNEAGAANTGGNNQDVNLVPVLTKTRTVTKIHVPNGFFVVLSGMIKDNEVRSYSRIPCLGGIPILGCFGKTQSCVDSKRNLMLFIRPLIIESDDDFEDITKRQQDVYREKSKFRRSWNYEVDEALNFGNIKHTDPDDMDRCCSDRQNP